MTIFESEESLRQVQLAATRVEERKMEQARRRDAARFKREENTKLERKRLMAALEERRTRTDRAEAAAKRQLRATLWLALLHGGAALFVQLAATPQHRRLLLQHGLPAALQHVVTALADCMQRLGGASDTTSGDLPAPTGAAGSGPATPSGENERQQLVVLVAVAQLACGSTAPVLDGAVGGDGEVVVASGRHSDDALVSQGFDLLGQQLLLRVVKKCHHE